MFLMPFIAKAGYGFFGSAVYIETNGSFAFYNCNGTNIGTQSFSGSLGSFAQNSGTLKLQGAEMKTWKDGNGNVCIPVLNYRIYSGTPTGNFIAHELPFFCNCSGGTFSCGGGSCSGNDQKWQKPGSTGSGLNIDLTTYTPGTYTIEVFYRIPGNQNGTSDCPDNVWDNNGGNPTNYTMSFTISAALPINLLSFYGSATSENILLSWTTNSETDNSHFEIQRSLNGDDFINIGKISAAGTSHTKNNYEFEDHEPLPSVNYYRLKQVNKDGSFNISGVIRVVFKDTDHKKIRIIPSLAQTSITCEIDDPKLDGKITIFNIYGQLIKEIEVNYRQKDIFIDISDLTSGQYLLRYSNQVVSESRKFIKQ